VFSHGFFTFNQYGVGIMDNTVKDRFRKRAFSDFYLPAGWVKLRRKDG
jgi:hypothetical protein